MPSGYHAVSSSFYFSFSLSLPLVLSHTTSHLPIEVLLVVCTLSIAFDVFTSLPLPSPLLRQPHVPVHMTINSIRTCILFMYLCTYMDIYTLCDVRETRRDAHFVYVGFLFPSDSFSPHTKSKWRVNERSLSLAHRACVETPPPYLLDYYHYYTTILRDFQLLRNSLSNIYIVKLLALNIYK